MSCWKRKRILRHLARKWGRPPVRPCEEQTAGSAVCTAYPLYCCPPPLSSAWGGFGILLDTGATNSSGPNQKTKIAVMWNAPCSLFYGSFGLTSVAVILFFSYKSGTSFCLRNTCCKYIYICTYTHAHTYMWNEWSLKELGWATVVCLLKINSTAVWRRNEGVKESVHLRDV